MPDYLDFDHAGIHAHYDFNALTGGGHVTFSSPGDVPFGSQGFDVQPGLTVVELVNTTSAVIDYFLQA